MGSSGAGKTTLMDVIAGRKTVGRATGAITANGAPLDRRAFAARMGYVEQSDVHVPLQTVGEALRFAARLRLPAGFPAAERERLVVDVMGLVELDELEGQLVGTPGEQGSKTDRTGFLLRVPRHVVAM
jgi:ABC-type multidrug transport system ATPase subunit